MSNPISPEHAAFDLPVLSSASVSPDERQILYVLTLGNRETHKHDSQIWIADVDGANRRRLTWSSASNHSPIWSPTGDRIAYVSTGDGDHPHALNLLPINGGEVRVLARHGSSPDALAWSPDGKTVAYSLVVNPANPNETPRGPNAQAPVRVTRCIDYKQDDFGYLNDVRSQIFLLDIASGQRRQLTSAPRDHHNPTWSNDGETIAVNLPFDNGMQGTIGLIHVASKEMEIIGNARSEMSAFAWSPDDTRLIILRDPFDYAIYDIAGKAIRQLTDDPGFEPDDSAHAIAWLDDATVLIHGFAQGSSALYRLDVGTGTLTDVSRQRWNAIHSGLHLFADGTRVLQTTKSIDSDVGLAVIDLASGEKTSLGNDAEAFFAESPAALWETLTIERAGTTVHGWLLKPADFDERQRYPVIIMVHGGPHMAHNYGIHPIAEVYATNGFVVLLVNPRGSTTYGRAFADAVLGDWGNEDWQDLEAMLDLVLERPYADGDRAGIYGYSYGGYMTAWVIGQTDRFKAAICGAPVFDNESMFGTSDIGHRFNIEMGGLPWGEDRVNLISSSPSEFVQNATTPTLIVQGEADERCPVGQSEQMFVSLKMAGCEVEFVRYPGGSHLFINSGEPAHRLDYFTRTLAWFKKYLGEPA